MRVALVRSALGLGLLTLAAASTAAAQPEPSHEGSASPAFAPETSGAARTAAAASQPASKADERWVLATALGLGGLALGASSVGVGVASELRAPMTVCASRTFFGPVTCRPESVLVGHDDGLVALAVVLGVGSLAALVAAVALASSTPAGGHAGGAPRVLADVRIDPRPQAATVIAELGGVW